MPFSPFPSGLLVAVPKNNFGQELLGCDWTACASHISRSIREASMRYEHSTSSGKQKHRDSIRFMAGMQAFGA